VRPSPIPIGREWLVLAGMNLGGIVEAAEITEVFVEIDFLSRNSEFLPDVGHDSRFDCLSVLFPLPQQQLQQGRDHGLQGSLTVLNGIEHARCEHISGISATYTTHLETIHIFVHTKIIMFDY
jgi:hypothetical protein